MNSKNYIVQYSSTMNEDKWFIVRAPENMSEEEIMDMVSKEPDVKYVYRATPAPGYQLTIDYTFSK